MTRTSDLRADALVMEMRLNRWADEAESAAGRDLAEDAALLVRQLREALACRGVADCAAAAMLSDEL